MIRASKVLALCGLLTAASSAPVSASWHFAPFVGMTFLGDTSIVDLDDAVRQRHWNLGGAVTFVGGWPVALEAIFVYVPGLFERGESQTITASRSIALMGNVVLTTPRVWNEYGLRPFVSGGLGLLHAAHNDPALPVRANLLAYNVGGGAVGFLTDRVGLRFDLRYYSNLRRSEEPSLVPPTIGRVRLHYWTGTVGVVFRY